MLKLLKFMNNNNLIKCSRISVNCVVNDPVDVRCGCPAYLGFDFNVKAKQAEDMKKFIVLALEKFEVPLANMYVSGTIDLSEKDVWTKERIIKSTNNDAEYLQGEALRNYGSSFRK